MAKFVTLVLNILEPWFWCLSPGFGPWESYWDHCQTPQIDLSGQNGHFWSFWPIKIRYRGLKMAKFVTFVWKVLETWFWCLSPGYYHGKSFGTILRQLRLSWVAKWPFCLSKCVKILSKATIVVDRKHLAFDRITHYKVCKIIVRNFCQEDFTIAALY